MGEGRQRVESAAFTSPRNEVISLMALFGSSRELSIIPTSLEPMITPSAPASAIVFACSAVLTPNPTQIGTLVTIHVLCYENVAVMKLAGANQKLRELLRMVGLEALMEMHHGTGVAVESFGPPAGEQAVRRDGPCDPRVKR